MEQFYEVHTEEDVLLRFRLWFSGQQTSDYQVIRPLKLFSDGIILFIFTYRSRKISGQRKTKVGELSFQWELVWDDSSQFPVHRSLS
jgi:hypothetical protein